MTSTKIRALAQFLDIKPSELTIEYENTFSFDQSEYLVLTDREATKACKDNILDSLWAFNASFILSHSKVSLSEKVLIKIQQELCEDANELCLSLISNKAKFIRDAIDCDGRGQFLSTYDSEENEETIGETTYFIYRTN